MSFRALLLALLVTAGCTGKDYRAGSTTTDNPAGSTSTPEEDAAALGREVYQLVDQAMSYKSSHRGRAPRSLRELGLDALTPTTSRTLTLSGGEPSVLVEFRTITSHSLRSCRGTSAVLEEAALGGGDFTLMCVTSSGGSTTLRARR